MKRRFSISGLIFTLIAAISIAIVFNSNPLIILSVLIMASFIPTPSGVSFMALQKEIWEKDIVDNLYKDNDFAKVCWNADQYVLAGKVVHIPVAGAAAQVKKNLTAFPQVAVNRTDSEIVYIIDTYYALPRQIQNIEKWELSYDKRQSVVGEDEKQLIQSAMEGLLYNWAPPASNVVLTTGADSALDLIDGTATGTRKVFTKTEFKAIAKKMANANLANTRRVGLLTANHYHQFFESLSDAEKTNFFAVADLKRGVIGMYMGIEIMMRSTVLRYRQVAGVWTVIDTQDPAFAATAADSAASLFWSEMCVERAKGDINVFDNPGQALYYGDVFSANLRLGGRIRRLVGVYAIVEDPTA